MSSASGTNAADDSADASYHASVGPGSYTTPTYPGARGLRHILFPFLDADYDDLVYTSASDILGLYAYKTESAQAGAALEWDLTERLKRDDARLSTLPNVRETPRFKAFASETISFVTADANIATDAAGRNQGTLGQANLWVTISFRPTLSVSFGPGVTWADSDYMHTFYAVTAKEAAQSPLTAFSTRAGIADTHLNGLAEWVIFSHYRIGASACLAHLKGDAAASPITLRHEQSTITGWIAYKFK